MKIPGLTSAILASVLVVAAVAMILHHAVFTRGALITPAGMHYAQWPWKASAGETVTPGTLLEANHTLSDALFQFYPWQVFTVRSLASGWIPLWNPFSYGGVPFVANAQSAVFYPLHWPAWLVPSLRVFTMAALLKIVLAGLFMAVFLEGSGLATAACVLGSVSFAFCSFMTSWLLYPHTNAAILLPLLLHATRGIAFRPGAGPFLLFAFAGAAQYLGGHPETSLHIVGVSGLWFLLHVRQSPRPRLAFALFTVAGVGGFLVAAVQLFPFLAYLGGSAALRERGQLATLDPTLPTDAWLTLLLPGRYGWPWNFTFASPVAWQATVGYAGAGVLLLALYSFTRLRSGGREIRFFQVTAILTALIVFGPSWVRAPLRYIPLIGIGSNNRLLLVLCFALAALAAYALHSIGYESQPEAKSARGSRLGWLAVVAIALCATALFEDGPDDSGGNLAAGLCLCTAVLVALALLRPDRRAIYLAGVVALACADLVVFAWRYNPHADPAALFPKTALSEFLRKEVASDMARSGRLLTVGWTMRPETQMIYSLSSIEGYDAMEFDRYRRLLDRSGAAALARTGDMAAASRPLLNLMGLRYIVTPPEGVVSAEDLTVAYDGPDGRVFINGQAIPRVSFVDQVLVADEGGHREVLDRLASVDFDLKQQVLLEPTAVDSGWAPPAPAGPAPGIRLERNTPNDVVVSVAGHGRQGFLVFGDAWDAGWKATVNGEPSPVLRANFCYRAVRLPEIDCTVRFLYQPAAFSVGLWVSAAALLSLIGMGLILRSGGRASPIDSPGGGH